MALAAAAGGGDAGAPALGLDWGAHAGEGGIPDGLETAGELAEGLVAQIDEVVDVARASADRYPREGADGPPPPGPAHKRCLKLLLRCGTRTAVAMELRHCAQLSANTPAGTKVVLSPGLAVRRGVILLRPEGVQLRGNGVPSLEAARRRAVEAAHAPLFSTRAKGAPPRDGNANPRAARMAHAAWSDGAARPAAVRAAEPGPSVRAAPHVPPPAQLEQLPPPPPPPPPPPHRTSHAHSAPAPPRHQRVLPPPDEDDDFEEVRPTLPRRAQPAAPRPSASSVVHAVDLCEVVDVRPPPPPAARPTPRMLAPSRVIRTDDSDSGADALGAVPAVEELVRLNAVCVGCGMMLLGAGAQVPRAHKSHTQQGGRPFEPHARVPVLRELPHGGGGSVAGHVACRFGRRHRGPRGGRPSRRRLGRGRAPFVRPSWFRARCRVLPRRLTRAPPPPPPRLAAHRRFEGLLRLLVTPPSSPGSPRTYGVSRLLGAPSTRLLRAVLARVG